MGFHASSLTCTIDGLAHLVSDDAAAEGVAAGRGVYIALCGHPVHAAAMASAAGRPCPRCDQQAGEDGQFFLPEPRRRRSERSWLRRLLEQHWAVGSGRAVRAGGPAGRYPGGTAQQGTRSERREALR